jgi:hypothetical protein
MQINLTIDSSRVILYVRFETKQTFQTILTLKQITRLYSG